MLLDGEGACEGLERVLRPPSRLRFQRLRNEALEEAFEVSEDAGDLGGAAARIILFHQRVIGRELQHLGAACRFLLRQCHDVLEGGQEVLPVILGPQLPPQLLAAHRRVHLAGHEIGGEAGAVDVAAAELGNGCPLCGVEVFVLRLVDPVGDVRCGCHFMRHGGQHAHCLGALLGASVRHVHGFVHAQHGLRMAQGFEAAAEMVEFGE